MTVPRISSLDPYPRKYVAVANTEMAYVDVGSGPPIVFLHGNPTSSYLWRNIIPHVEGLGRCLAPDLVGMGQSGKNPSGSYRFVDHVPYLDAWFDAVGVAENATIVGHDWGGALGLHWARRHPERVSHVIYMETFVRPLLWEEWPDAPKRIFQAMRSSSGEELVLQKNVFVERILPASVLRKLAEEEMAVYRAPYAEPGESRRPTLTWPREIPLEGEPPDVTAIVKEYSDWLGASLVPKLFINADPGAILVGPQREYCRSWLNQVEITVKGNHFLQEDSPQEIGEAIAEFLSRFD